MANVILDGIKDYGFMHSSDFLNEALIYAISLDLHSVGDYMESRLQKVPYMDTQPLKVSKMFEKYSKKVIKDSKVIDSPSLGKYCQFITPIWAAQS